MNKDSLLYLHFSWRYIINFFKHNNSKLIQRVGVSLPYTGHQLKLDASPVVWWYAPGILTWSNPLDQVAIVIKYMCRWLLSVLKYLTYSWSMCLSSILHHYWGPTNAVSWWRICNYSWSKKNIYKLCFNFNDNHTFVKTGWNAYLLFLKNQIVDHYK